MLEILFSEHTLTTGISLATPILLCALGGAVCSKSGNFNIAMEGFMLIGAFFGVVGAYYMNSVAAGLLFAVAASVLIALLYGLFLVKFRGDEIILGFGFNMLAVALTGWLLEPVFGGAGSFYNPATPSLGKIAIPILKDIPVLRCLSGHNIIVYLSWVLVVVIYFMMYKTPLGFRLRALGENPRMLEVSGLRTDSYRYLAEFIVGALCGLAGAFLSIGNLSMFTENMTSGRGYIAVAAVGFSNANVLVTALAGLIFGLTSSAAIQLQGVGFPSQLVDMTPYVITIIIIIISAFKRKKIR
ncbi:MAG TPA: ABC transporter permease [Feifaniaceae bacterium]|nr:ABC transporter permease [Feifaniaceae bacterium]